MGVVDLVRAERADLADLLDGLTPEQWDHPTLCAGWSVREVVAHVVSYEELDLRTLAGRLVRARFSPDRANADGVREYALRSPAELVALLREHLTPRGITAALGGRVGLTDALVHHQDVRRPLGLPRTVPAERLRVALATVLAAPTVGGLWRVRGLRVVADDVDFAFGRGPEVHGTGEALLLAVAGRAVAADELTGPGATTLAARAA